MNRHFSVVRAFGLLSATCVVALTACLSSSVAVPGATAGQAPAAGAAPQTLPEGRKIFYASHSLMWDVPDPLTEEVKAYGIKDHTVVGLQKMGFSTTLEQWQKGAQAKKALETGKIDDFVMSPMEMPDAGVDNFVELGLQHNPKMRFFVQNNWAGFNNDGNKAHQFGGKSKPWDQTTEEELKTLNTVCEKAFEDQVKKINEKYKADAKIGRDVIFIIPTSQANTELRTAIIKKEFPGLEKQSQLFLDQIGHPTPPLVSLNVYIHFATIYGKSPVGLPMPTYLKRPNNAKWDEKLNQRLEELAWKTVTEYPLSGVQAPGKDAK